MDPESRPPEEAEPVLAAITPLPAASGILGSTPFQEASGQDFPQIPQDTTRPRPPARDSIPGFPGFPGFPGQEQQSADSLRRADSLARRADSLRARLDSLARHGLDSTFQDTSRVLRPLITDSTYVVFLDSTARLREFTHRRTDSIQVLLFPDRTYPLFGTAKPTTFRRELVVDTSGTRVTISETMDGAIIRQPISLPLRDYIAQRQRYELRKLFADEARRTRQLEAKNDLGELLSTITKIQIPLPPNPVFSIFGKSVISLNISGAVDIKAGFRNTKSDQMTLSRLDQSRNEPDFSQEVQVNVNGMIGDKLNINADWNTQRQFEYENQLKIKYTGYEDEIVQSVEAGNVSLSTPSSFIGSSQALFGVKAKFQAGPLTLTALASQKKGQIKQVDVSGGAKEQTFEMRAFEYATNHFFVDTTYEHYYEDYYRIEPPTYTPEMQETQIVEEEVWVQRQAGIPDPNERQGVAILGLPERGSAGYSEQLRGLSEPPGQVETAPFVRLDRTQYELDADGYLGVLSLNVNVGDQLVVGIAYRTANNVQFGEFARDLPDTTGGRKLILKMIKPKNLLSNGHNYPLAWRMLLKNIYPISGIGRNLKKQGFYLDIFRRVPSGEDQNSIENQPLLRVLGLDQYTGEDAQTRDPDGQFDFRPGRTINEKRAELIFPTLRPFDDGIRRYMAANSVIVTDTTLTYPEVYDTTTTFAQQSVRNKYFIRGKATGEASSRYSLGFNVVEGSVQVLLNNAPMVQNIDYTVDYILGEVLIKNERALVPGANLQIKFEQNDLFQLASKTLLGARGDLALGQNTALGFTIMNLNQQTLSDKVRLGEEPNNNTILGMDGATQLDLPFMTRALDAMPILQTREPSQLKVSGEAAYMIPDPNTRKSTIVGDNGEGIAYIDDFEGARRTIPIGNQFAAWTQSSPLAGDIWTDPGSSEADKMNSKAKMIWFNRLPSDVQLTDIYPAKEVGNNPANNLATVMDVQYFPTTRGQFNYTLNPDSTLTRTRNWNGIMKPLSISAINLLKENVNFIEIWMRIDQAPRDGSAKLIIDLGSISERVLPAGPKALSPSPNSEDLVLGDFPNGTLQDGEDVGLDMRDDNQERTEHAELVQRFPGLAGDPSGDDYFWSNQGNDFSRINGTDGNKDGPVGRIPDTEDLNANGITDRTNSYFEYVLPLDTSVANNPFISGGGKPPKNATSGYSLPLWYQYRIPIRDFVRKVGSPTAENIEFIRIALANVTDTVFVRIADFNLVGSQWQKVERAVGDSTFDVGVVNIEENPGTYSSPPGVIRERDKTKPEETVLANEQSMAFFLTGLEEGKSAEAVRFYTFKALDLFNYRTMKMFVHGDEQFHYIDPQRYDTEIYFRFGLDSLNFYEYRAPIRPGWDPLNDVTINFTDLTAIKQARDSLNVLSPPIPVRGGPPGATYRILGNPSLTQVIYLAIGVHNPAGKEGKRHVEGLFGQVWVNELRLVSVDDSRGWAYRADAQLKLADLGTVAFNYQKVDPNFHTLEQRFGSRMTSSGWGLNTSMELAKFLPSEWAGSSLPVSFSHSESVVKPRYLPNSDVPVAGAAALTHDRVLAKGGTEEEAAAAAQALIYEAESKRTTDTWAAPSLRIALPSPSWYVRDIVNKLNFGFSYTKSRERSPAVVSRTSWSWNSRMAYQVSLSPDYYFQPFQKLFDGAWFLDEYKDLKIYFAPSSLSWSVTAVRSRDVSLQRTRGAQTITSRNFTASRQMGFSWKLSEGGLLNPAGDYSLGVESTLLKMELDPFGRQRSFSKILGDIFGGDKLVNFGLDTRYQQRNNITTRPNIPNIFGMKKFVDIQFGYSVDYAWQNTLTGDLGKSAGFNNAINVALTVRLKQIFDPLFEESKSFGAVEQQAPGGGRRSRESSETVPDSTTRAAADSAAAARGPAKIWQQLKMLMKVFIKIPFLDYDNVSISFTQNNSAQNSGVVGRTGFVNFWGRVPFFQSSLARHGPSRLYQLGLISDPSGRLTNFRFIPKLPFVAWDVEPGLRAANGALVNTYRQTNRLTLKTSRALWEGARLDLNWNVGWSYNRTVNIQTDGEGNVITAPPRDPRAMRITTSGNVDRSFLTMPNVLFLGVFKTGLKEVAKRYGELKSGTGNGQSGTSADLGDEEKLSQAFEEGFEALPFFRKILGPYFPRVNWTFRWDGLEKLPMFQTFVSRLSLDHAYTSNYTRQFQNRPGGGGERTDGQHVAYGFAPLAGLNFTFKELAKGSFGATLRYNTNTSYDLTTSSRNIVEVYSQEVSVSANYTRRGFEIPFFGLSLNNDIDISAAYSVTKNSRTTFDVTKLESDTKGTPLEGSTRTTMEPRVKYVLSSRVTAAVYYRYTKIAPDASGSRVPGTTTNEAGLDVHISIQ